MRNLGLEHGHFMAVGVSPDGAEYSIKDPGTGRFGGGPRQVADGIRILVRKLARVGELAGQHA